MPTNAQVISHILTIVTGRSAERDVNLIREKEQKYLYFDDETLRNAAERYLAGESTGPAARPRPFARLSRWLKVSFSADDRDCSGLAIASAAFRRAPADLVGEGVHLRDSQLAAASFMLNGGHVQMDTGEGKTYSIVAAAFAALGRVERVYVLTANEVLAERDANRTRPFWDWLGVSLGLCTAGYRSTGADHPSWGAQVVYTTAGNLTSKHIGDALWPTDPENPILRSAVFLDESDAILFDSNDQWVQPTSIATEHSAWVEAFGCEAALNPASFSDEFALHGRVRLNADGWQQLRSYQVQTPA